MLDTTIKTESDYAHRWSYDYTNGGAVVYRVTLVDGNVDDWDTVASVPNGVVAQEMCNWLNVYSKMLLPLDTVSTTVVKG